MPVSDLPHNLRIMLDTIVDNNMLRSWQVYSEKDGLTVKLRFNSVTEAQQGESDKESVAQVSYVKKSPCQQRRDTNRAQQRRTVTTRSQKLQTVDTPIERPRNMYVNSASQGSPIESPISVASVCDLDPSTPEFFMPPGSGQCDSQVALNQVGHASSNTDINTHMDYGNKVILSADSTITADSESDDDELEKTLSCLDWRCSYGPYKHSKSDEELFIDNLLECTYPDCGGIICNHCKLKGAHKSHNRYLKVMTHEEFINL